MPSVQNENILIRFPCLLKSVAKKRHPRWHVCVPPAHVRPTLWAPADKVSLHQWANGHLKVTDSSGLGPAWVTDSMSSAPTLSYSRKCISFPSRQGDSSSHSVCLKCFPTWQVEPSSPICHSLKRRGRNATCHSFLVTTGQKPKNITIIMQLLQYFFASIKMLFNITCIYASTVMRLARKTYLFRCRFSQMWVTKCFTEKNNTAFKTVLLK